MNSFRSENAAKNTHRYARYFHNKKKRKKKETFEKDGSLITFERSTLPIETLAKLCNEKFRKIGEDVSSLLCEPRPSDSSSRLVPSCLHRRDFS